MSIACSAADEEMLLVDWLNSLVYEMATSRMLFSRFALSIEGLTVDGPGDRSICLRATAWGEHVEIARHRPAVEVKGASYCELAVPRHLDGQWLAQCVVDV